jgi:hypothetical protein
MVIDRSLDEIMRMKIIPVYFFITAILFLAVSSMAEPSATPADSQLSLQWVPHFTAGQQIFAPARKPPLSEIAVVEGLPPVGKWMYQHDFQKAHWLGVPWEGKTLFEPVNLLFADAVSKSPNEAISRLTGNLRKAGYTERKHHSSGYIGYIDRSFYTQLPRADHFAFANEIAEVPNNHGRIFGPCLVEGKYYFIGAFSREGINPMAKIRHKYESFNRARDDLAGKLDKKSGYKIVRYVDLHNTVVGDALSTTGDHDGIAVLLELSSVE